MDACILCLRDFGTFGFDVEGPSEAIFDRAFASQLNLKFRLTEQAYEGMMFRDSVKEGFFEFIKEVGKYREVVEKDNSTQIS